MKKLFLILSFFIGFMNLEAMKENKKQLTFVFSTFDGTRYNLDKSLLQLSPTLMNIVSDEEVKKANNDRPIPLPSTIKREDFLHCIEWLKIIKKNQDEKSKIKNILRYISDHNLTASTLKNLIDIVQYLDVKLPGLSEILKVKAAPQKAQASDKKQSKLEKSKRKLQKFCVKMRAGVDVVKYIMNERKESVEIQQKLLKVFQENDQKNVNVKRRVQMEATWPPLMVAVVNNDLKSVIELINDPKININAQAVGGWTVLAEAARKGYFEIVKALCSHKNIVIDTPLTNGTTPLMIAISNKHYKVVQLLLLQGADINQVIVDEGSTPLIKAIRYGTPKIVTLLISVGAEELDINAQDKWGESALFYAVKQGDIDLVKNLVGHGG